MKFPTFLLAGLVAGAALRLFWPEPESFEPSLASGGEAAQSGVKRARGEKVQTGAVGPSKTADEAQERLKAKLRQVGLSPWEGQGPPTPSWLYVSPPLKILLKSPEYVEASIVATEVEVDDQCAPLFVQLGLSREKEERLRRTLAEMVFARHEISELAAVDPKSKALERVREMVAASDEAHRARVQAQLGAQDFSRFEAYFQTLQERHELRAGFQRVASLAEPLTSAQRDALVAARHATKKGEALPGDPLSSLTPAQQAAFAEWQVDDLALRKLGQLTRIRYGPEISRIRPIYGEPWDPEL